MKIILGVLMGSVISLAALLFVVASFSEAKAKQKACPFRGGKCIGFRCREFWRCTVI